MKLGDGVEQAIHAVTLLASLPKDGVLSAADMAEHYGVSPSYLLKHLQALSRAEIVRSVPGPQGGYCLAVSAGKITLLDVLIAVEGAQPAFRCKEIRQNGPNPLPSDYFTTPCKINVAMLRAEQAYREALRTVTIAEIIRDTLDEDDGSLVAHSCAFFDEKMRLTKPDLKE